MSDQKAQRRREANRRYAAESRARKREGRLRSAREAADAADGEVMAAVEESLTAMKWLTASDSGIVAMARRAARLVDAAARSGDVAFELRAHALLSRLLDSLGGAPRVRVQMEVRSRKAADPETAPNGSTNTTTTRPPKRVERER